MRSATSRWNISTSRSYQGGHGSSGEPGDQQRGRDVVGQVGDDARRCAAEMRARIERRARRRRSTVEAAGIARGDLRERRDRAVVALDRDDAPRALREQRARQSAGPGADLDHVDAVERAGGARDAGGEIEVEQEVLAERFPGRRDRAGGSPRAAAADRRSALMRGRDRRDAAAARPASRAASWSAAIRLDGSARPVPAMSKAVPWSGEVRTNGRPSVTLTA